MPKQYVVCGRPVPRLGTRHISLLLVGLALFAVFSLLWTLPGAIPATPSLRAAGNRFSVPKSFKSPWMNRLNPFKQPAHPPRVQKGDTDGDSVWYANWNWLLMPFSSSVTLDENRALLPVLKDRTPIYCYYDNTIEQDDPDMDAESDLLLAWRRAWWAQGFRPIILSSAEAINNPLYEEIQKLEGLTPALKTDLMRWLAWGNMGDGLLAHHLLFPMGPHNDPFLTYLRRGEFPGLTRFKDLDDGLFVGTMGEVTAVIRTVMDNPESKKAEGVVEAVESAKDGGWFTLDDAPKSLAFYSGSKLEAIYPKVGQAIAASHAAGTRSLTQLINSHLHLTWQSTFTNGISVVKPLPHHTTFLITPAYELAQRLAHCPESPLPDTCPPNRPDCRPCDDSKPMKISTPSSYSPENALYTIGTVPHPYTISTLNHLKTQLSIAWIRRESPRDAWITSLTSSLFEDSMSTTPRLIRFKEAVASDETSPAEAKGKEKGPKGGGGISGGAYRSLWLPAEQPIPEDLDWHFGFVLPDRASYAEDGNAAGIHQQQFGPPIPLHSPQDGPHPTESDLALEPALFSRAQTIVLSSSSSSSHSRIPDLLKSSISKESAQKQQPAAVTKEDLALRDAVEAWNLADTEAWRFARAYLARSLLERRTWEDDEAKYAGGVGTEKAATRTIDKGGGGSNDDRARKGSAAKRKGGRVWDRWMDRN
ncbi:hypothetical protein VTI28DRAFT_15 [Corynascus sepedonium]